MIKVYNEYTKLPIGVIIQSLLVGFFMDIKCINYILNTYGFDENSSIMTFLYIASILVIIFVGFINNTFQRPSFQVVLLLFYIALSYFVTTAFGGHPLVSLPHLLVFTISAFLIPSFTKIDVKTTLRAIMLYPVLGINRLSDIFVFVADWDEWVSMGLSYAFYVPITAMIIYLAIYFKTEDRMNKIITILLSVVNLVYLFMIFQFGSRGPIMLLLLLCIFLFVVRPLDSGGFFVKKKNLMICLVLGFIFLLAFDQIMLLIDDLLGSLGISSHAVTKFIRLSAEGDIDHGRNEIAIQAVQGFFDSPIWGNGLDCFDQNTGNMYPHNVILQILYDGGLLFLILFVPIIKNAFTSLRHGNKAYFSMFCFLVFAGIAGGFFSGDLWKHTMFWMFIGFALSKSFLYE